MEILTIAYYTAIKYLRNPLVMIAYIFSPVVMAFFLTGTVENKFIDTVKATSIGNSNLQVTMIQSNLNNKIAIVCLILFLFYGCILCSYTVISDFKNNTNLRFKCSPVNFLDNIIGKSLGNIGVLSICTVISVLMIKYGFNVNFGSNLFLLILIFMLYIVIINCLGIIFADFCKNIYICALLSFAFNFTMVFPVMVDTYSPINSKIIENISKFSIHNYVVKAIYGIINKDVYSTTSSILILSVTTVVIFCLSLIAGRRALK